MNTLHDRIVFSIEPLIVRYLEPELDKKVFEFHPAILGLQLAYDLRKKI